MTMIMKSVETLVDERTIDSEIFGANLDMKKTKVVFAIFSRVNLLSKSFLILKI